MNRLITRSDVVRCSDIALAALFREASEALTRSRPGSPERRNAAASLENIARERAARLHRPRL